MFTVPVVPLSLSSLLVQMEIQYQQFETYSAELHFVSVNQKYDRSLKIKGARSVMQCSRVY